MGSSRTTIANEFATVEVAKLMSFFSCLGVVTGGHKSGTKTIAGQ
jgi:hypothetical protein